MGGLDDAKILFIQELKAQIIEIESKLYGKEVTKESIRSVGKIVHKVKGAAGFFHFTELEAATKTFMDRCKQVEEKHLTTEDQSWKELFLSEYQTFKNAVVSLIDV